MGIKKQAYFLAFWLLLAIAIHLFSMDSARVEAVYSNNTYQEMAEILRLVFGWLPFSIGDLFYGAVVLFAILHLIRFFKNLRKRGMNKNEMLHIVLKNAIFVLITYVLFNLLWGINYNRQGIAVQLGLSSNRYSSGELIHLNGELLKKVNESKIASIHSDIGYSNSDSIFMKAQSAFHKLGNQYAFLNYKQASVKSSLWGWLGNYLGFGGYYNPFTGEAQVNTALPLFLQPYTTCHEIAHQLGYAKENEANFVGYLAAANSSDTFFQYSVYVDLFLYANRNLAELDSLTAKGYALQLLPQVKSDLKEWKEFNRRHKNPVEPMIDWMYGKYLQNNEQPTGLLSYDEVTGFLIAYYRKYGKI